MNILRFVSSYIESNSYLIINEFEKTAIVIDPCDTEEILNYIDNNNYSIEYIILTHEHYDHISGVNKFREKYSSKVICSEKCNIGIQNDRLNMSTYFEAMLAISYKNTRNHFTVKPYICKKADQLFNGYYLFVWMDIEFHLYETPGHSNGSICIVMKDEYLFSGDSLLKDYNVITRLPGGSLKEYKEKTEKILSEIKPEIIVLPGHGDKFILCML